uniref:(northern house mosquito) hypothetical protein n=1 Tax=Culex pipiens TaxID=7175 RepID=A0A8D8KT65_CULPI
MATSTCSTNVCWTLFCRSWNRAGKFCESCCVDCTTVFKYCVKFTIFPPLKLEDAPVMGECTAAMLLDSVVGTKPNLLPAVATELIKLVNCVPSVAIAALAVELVLDTMLIASVVCFTISLNRIPRFATLVERLFSVLVKLATSAGVTMLPTFKLVMGIMLVNCTTLTAVPSAIKFSVSTSRSSCSFVRLLVIAR